MTIGCVIGRDISRYVQKECTDEICLTDEVLEGMVFIRMTKPEHLNERCEPMLRSMRKAYGEAEMYQVRLHGLGYVGKHLYLKNRYAWLEKHNTYK